MLQQASGQMYKDDVHGFSSTCDICFVNITQSRRQKGKYCNHTLSSYTVFIYREESCVFR